MSVLRMFKSPVELSRGDIQKIKFIVQKFYLNRPDGIYFISDNMRGPCFSKSVYDYFEEQAKINDVLFELNICGKPSMQDVENFKKEIISTAVIDKIDEEIDIYIEEWKKQTKRNKFNMIVVKKGTFIESYPIIDPLDLDVIRENKDRLVANL